MDRETAEMYRNNVAQAAAVYQARTVTGYNPGSSIEEWTYPEPVREMALKVITQGLRSLLRPENQAREFSDG